jgi:membrane associated rhomboid family serine protease
MSAAEAATNTAVGYGIAVLTNLLVLPLFGMRPSLGDSAAIGGVFTALSLMRSYALRRLFERARAWR